MRTTAKDGISILGKEFTGTRELIIESIGQGKLSANKCIAGIPCPDEESSQKMLGIFTKENIRIIALKEKLQKLNLPFRAIISTELFNQIKVKKEVYTFKHINEEGYVSISESSTQNFLQQQIGRFIKKMNSIEVTIDVIVSVCICIFIEGILLHFIWNNSNVDFWATLISINLFVLSWVGYLLCIGAIAIIEVMSQWYIFSTPVVRKKIEREMSKQGLRIFWPRYVDPSCGPEVKIDFIVPPEKVKSNILMWKKGGYTVHISAQKEAFSLDIKSLRSHIESELEKIFEETKKQRELELNARLEARKYFWQNLDPIVSVEIDEFTVLIDAYGGKSFVSESEVVDSVMKYYNEKLQRFQTTLN